MARGTTIGRYELLDVIGRGGVGTVFRARSPSGEVAIKLLHAATPDAIARFERETRLQGALGEAEGFVPLVETGTSPRGPYLVMPLVPGGTLRSKLENGRFSIEDTVALGSALAAALGHAHGRGIVHRDMKPENVLFTAAGTPLIADLGLAKHWSHDALGASQSVLLSADGTLRGTAGYMPPEQMRDAKEAGPAADVFALGAILYECLAGAPAFEGQSVVELITKVEAAALTPLREVIPETPPWLVAVIARALAHEAPDRFVDGAAFARALDHPAAPRSRARYLLAAGVAVAALAAAGIAATRPTENAPPPASVPAGPKPAPLGDLTRGNPSWKLLSTWGRVDWKHAGVVSGVAFSPDGTKALSIGRDGTAKLWDVATGQELTCFVAGTPLTACAFSPDGKHVVLGGEDGTARILDLERGVAHELRKRSGSVTAVAWSPDGKSILAASGSPGSDGTTITLRTARDGVLLHELEPVPGIVNSLSFLRGGKRAVSSSNVGVIVVWDLESGREIGRTPPQGHRMSGVAVSGEGVFAVSADCEAGTATLWDIDRCVPGPALSTQRWEVLSTALSPDGTRVLVGSRDALECWDLPATGRPRWRVTADWVTSVQFSPDGKRVLAGTQDHVVHLLDASAGKELASRAGFDGPVHGLACDPKGAIGITMNDVSVELREARDGGAVRTFAVERTLMGATLSPDGSLLLAQRDQEARIHERLLWNTRTGQQLWAIPQQEASPVLAVSNDRRFGLAAGKSGFVHRFPLATGETDAASGGLHQADGNITSIAFLGGNSESWLTAAYNGFATLMTASDAGLDTLPRRIDKREHALTAIAGSRDARHALVGDVQGGLRLLTLDRRLSEDLRPARTGEILALVFSPDDQLAVSASRDGTVAFFDDKGVQRGTIDLASSHDHATALSFDGPRTLLVGTARGVVHRFQLLPRASEYYA